MSISPLLSSVGQFSPATIRPEISQPTPGKIGEGLPYTSFENALADQIQTKTDPILHPNQLRMGAASPTGNFVSEAVEDVQRMQMKATQATQKVIQGDGAALHQSMIAMEEASVSFQLLVEMRNKIVESLQELMRMQI
jgi:flagellar hook-basal body complex protein FliE